MKGFDCNQPCEFSIQFEGPDGVYCIKFYPRDGWEGELAVTIAGKDMVWPVETVATDAAGKLILSGLTTGTSAVWRDVFWFELCASAEPPVIRYWGNQVLWREDRAAFPNPHSDHDTESKGWLK